MLTYLRAGFGQRWTTSIINSARSARSLKEITRQAVRRVVVRQGGSRDGRFSDRSLCTMVEYLADKKCWFGRRRHSGASGAAVTGSEDIGAALRVVVRRGGSRDGRSPPTIVIHSCWSNGVILDSFRNTGSGRAPTFIFAAIIISQHMKCRCKTEASATNIFKKSYEFCYSTQSLYIE